ncbi:MAG: S41 family peptidase [Acidobacteriota bacterium]|nr:S41 family peptidase [Blastocatellia bacterium]MDW8413629.1 S41 family peptidase [Acidobacteriota bacterium]
MHKFSVFLAIGIISAAAVTGGLRQKVQATFPAQSDKPRAVDVERSFSEAVAVVENNYVDRVENDVLTKASIQGLLRTLDPHSSYFDSKEFQELQSEQHSQFFGIGVTINRRNDRVYVLSTIKNTPAERAGLRYGDAIIKVDGKSAVDWSTQEVMERVRGPKGEPVEIEIERPGVPKPLTFRIYRDAVPLPSIRNAYMIRPGIGYIALVGGFNHTTEQELLRAIEDLKLQGMQSLILDLRNNPGGLLTQAVKVANIFLQRGQVVVSVRGRNERFESRVYEAVNPDPEDMPLVVLINRSTASASEIVAGAIQDHDRGLIVGETSFGKGLVQTVFHLPYGSGLTLTTAKYYTPSGRLIQREYRGLSLYDYYVRREQNTNSRTVHRTDAGRNVYSGGGIKPDIEVKGLEANPLRVRIFEGVFDFVRQLVNGQMQGFANFKITKTVFNHKLRDDEFQITDKLLAAFRAHISLNERFKLTDAQFNENLAYIKQRLREEIVTAAYGTEVAQQVFLASDPQTLRAIEELPRARLLAENARAARFRR